MPIPDDIADYRLPDSEDALLAECDFQAFRATGPGGQSVNTTDSAVRLRHRPTGIVVTCRRQRSQHLNKLDCLKRLRHRIEEAQRVPAERIETTKPRSADRRRLEGKRRAAARKQMRRPPEDEG